MEENDNISHKLLDYGLKAVLVAGAVYGITKIVKTYQKSNTEHNVEEKPEVSQAMSLYSALNPSGMEWMKKMDGTNKDIVFSTAKDITDLNKVQNAYRKLYNTSLLDDLRQELSPEDYTKFLNTLKFSTNNTNNGTSRPKTEFKKGIYIATKLPTNIRKTPKNISKWSFDSNIIKLAESGKYIGLATGKTVFDTSSGGTGTLYLEIQSLASDTKKAIFFWAAASQIKSLSQEDYSSGKYAVFSLNEKDTLQGFDVIHKRVIAFVSVPILNEQFKMVGIASPLQQLGYSIMELNDNRGNEYVKFITNQKKQYWVNKKFVQMI